MLLALFNSITSWFLKRRIDQIQEFVQHPHGVQERILLELTNAAKNTELGKAYNFGGVTNYQQFIHNTPLTTYESFRPFIEHVRRGEHNIFWHTPIRWFTKSSGVTNVKSKFIPVSEKALRQCHYRSSKDILCLYLNNSENSNLFRGKSLRLGGSKELYEQNGIYFDNLSAILIENPPFWAELSCAPSNKVSLMSEWEGKLRTIIGEVKNENITSIAGVFSWVLTLLNQILEEAKEEHLLEPWKHLEVYFHGNASFTPYREQYRRIIPSDTFRYYGIYSAFEGFFAIQDRNNSDEMLLMLDCGIFYEFIPMDTFGTPEQTVIPLSEVAIGKNYTMVATTNAGLWRYLIGDAVRSTSVSPYRIRTTGRTRHFVNVFGEELTMEDAERALGKACEQTSSHLIEYTVAPIFIQDKLKDGHEWVVELGAPPAGLEHFIEVLDTELKKLNSDYEAKHYSNMTLNMSKVHQARTGLFHDWLKGKDKLDGQNKVPRLSNSRECVEELLKLL